MAIDLHKLKSLFIVDDTKQTENKENKEQTDSENNTTVPPVIQGNVDQSILDTLFKSLSNNNLQGFDYFEYKQSLKTLRGMLDEQTAFKSAFATAATMGITKDKLLETANFYVKVLEKEKEKFDEAARSQGGGAVDAKKKEIELATKSIADKSEQIRKMTDEISAAQAKINELKAFVLQAENKIAETSKNFVASYNTISTEINTDIEKIKQYIQ
jgi:predicted nuclease with TOPRIM domain